MIYNHNINKESLFIKAKAICRIFCELNSIEKPIICDDDKLQSYGEYTQSDKIIWVNVNKCKEPVKNPGYSWSYPGYKSDRTVLGVTAHETGHFCHFHFVGSKFNKMLNDFYAIRNEEKSLTSYEPNINETIAESFRLFILNPDLLKQGRPKRYKGLIDNGFNPIINNKWQDILINANPRIIEVCEKWIKI